MRWRVFDIEPAEDPSALKLDVLRCPACAGALHDAVNSLRCARCGATWPSLFGAIDVRRKGPPGRYAPAPLDGALAELADRPLDATLRALCARAAPGARPVRETHLAEGIEYAWKLFIDLRPSMRVLDLACGYGARSASLARHGVEVVAVATHPDAAVVTRKRLDAVRPDAARDRHCVLLADDICRLPLADAWVDLVLLPVDLHACTSGIPESGSVIRDADGSGAGRCKCDRRSLMTEVGRVLRTNAQAVLMAANRWSIERLIAGSKTVAGLGKRRWPVTRYSPDAASNEGAASPMSRAGYARLLSAIDLDEANLLVVPRDRSGNVLALRDVAHPVRTAVRMGMKATIKQHVALAPEFVFVARRGGAVGRTLLQRALDGVAAVLRARGHSPGEMQIARRHVSRKDKLVVEVVSGVGPLMVRLCLSPASRTAEQRAAVTLDTLFRVRPGATWYPRLLATGDVDGLLFTAEAKVEGEALTHGRSRDSERAVLTTAAAMLQTINPDLAKRSPTLLQGALYDEIVSIPLERASRVIASADVRLQLQRFFERELQGLEVKPGIAHGDLSVSNILVRPDGGEAAIDWENSRLQGLPILDAIAILRSNALGRGNADPPGVARSRMALQDFSADEGAFLTGEYARTGTPHQAHVALVYLQWVDVVSSLLDFSFMQWPDALAFYVEAVVRNLPPMVRDS